ncbi:uncharacterized protein LOC110604615 isoform X2 [Manihot esculenta]|uniref:uncharacterized protein LOC110604615 isoform X2 n=1 Tax=Manihot esculenta TaxID=3983 RepID=UPI000B5D222A|nr:uncharacterized protein LOC110604615 isoform X2 [Manihot esculenta]
MLNPTNLKFSKKSKKKFRQEEEDGIVSMSSANEKASFQSFKGRDWHLEGAFDVFYNQPQIKTFTDSRYLERLYNRYKDPHVDMVLVDGITLLCNDLQVDPQDIVMDQSTERMIGTGFESQGLHHLSTSPVAFVSTTSVELIYNSLGPYNLLKLQKIIPSLSSLSSLAYESCQLGNKLGLHFPNESITRPPRCLTLFIQTFGGYCSFRHLGSKSCQYNFGISVFCYFY